MQSPLDSQGGGFGGEPKEDLQQPWYVKYGIRALGTAAGGLAIFMGALNVLTSVFSPICMLFSIWQMVVGFVVVCIEAPFCCQFVEHVQVVARKIEEKPLWIKAAVYIFGPLPSLIFCFGISTLLGGGVVIGVGVLYAMIALGKKASREEMARNAQTINPNPSSNGTNLYQSNPPPQSDKSSFFNVSRDPVQAAAAQWASQSAPQTFEAPPPYSSSISSNQPPRAAWDQSFVANETRSASGLKGNMTYGANPVSSDPNNPFQ